MSLFFYSDENGDNLCLWVVYVTWLCWVSLMFLRVRSCSFTIYRCKPFHLLRGTCETGRNSNEKREVFTSRQFAENMNHSLSFLQTTSQRTPRSRVLFSNLIVAHPIKFFVFYGARNFITVFTAARHWTLS
jgi:hypothetical protein